MLVYLNLCILVDYYLQLIWYNSHSVTVAAVARTATELYRLPILSVDWV